MMATLAYALLIIGRSLDPWEDRVQEAYEAEKRIRSRSGYTAIGELDTLESSQAS